MSAYLLLLLQTLALYPILSLIERKFPAGAHGKRKIMAFNIFCITINLPVSYYAVKVLEYLPRPALPHLLTVGKPTNWPEVLFAELLILLVLDLFIYWWHRAMHSIPFLWSMHKLHHADTELSVTTQGRNCLFEGLIRPLFIIYPMGLLFDLPYGATAFGVSLALLIGHLRHMNIRLHYGWLTPILSGPQVHRIHHSNSAHHAYKNFADIYPIWDIIFGTYYRPQRDEYPETGLIGGAEPPNLILGYLEPFPYLFKLLKRYFRGFSKVLQIQRFT